MTITPEERARAITLLNQLDWCVYRDAISLEIEEVVRFERLARATAMREAAEAMKTRMPNHDHMDYNQAANKFNARAAELEDSCHDY